MTLSYDQIKAINKLEDFIFNSDENAFSLIGKPGTGKTQSIKELIKRLQEKKFYSFMLCAPTHKAASVLRAGTGEEVTTIHQLLSLSPKLDILEFDLRNLLFELTGKPQELFRRIIICDEASMVNDSLFDYITQECVKNKSKIIWVGDYKQLQPVKTNKLSKVFTISNKFELTTNHRQGSNPIVQLCEDSRHDIISDFSKYQFDDLKIFTSAKNMMKNAIEDFRVQNVLEFAQLCKILTYTNDRVNKFNNYIHSNISSEGEYCFNELLTGYSNYNDIKNSEDYIVKKHRIVVKTLPYIDKSIIGYELNIKSLDSQTLSNIFILSRNTDNSILEEIALTLENIRITAINRKSLWKSYYNLDRSFAVPFDLILNGRTVKQKTLDYGYSSTVHKSQSSSYEVVYFDNNSLQFCHNKNEKRQLQHVAISRVKEKLNILI